MSSTQQVQEKDVSDGVNEKAVPSPALNDGVTAVFRKRPWYAQVPFASRNPAPPPKDTIDDAQLTPEATAGWFSIVTFNWLTPLLTVGYTRPLQPEDLWRLADHNTSAVIADKILASFESRVKEAELYNQRLANGEISPGLRAIWWNVRGDRKGREERWRQNDGRKKASLTFAMNDSIKWWLWTGSIFKMFADFASSTSMLVLKAIIVFASESYANHMDANGRGVPAIGKGIGLAFCLLALQVISSLCLNHAFYRSSTTGILLRGGLISAIYKRSLRLSSRARSTLTNGKLVNHISTDVSRIDRCCNVVGMAFTHTINLAFCMLLLILQLGPSALAGFAMFAICTPLQTQVMKHLFKYRQKTMVWTDKRARLLQELLGNMKIVKFFTWEAPFLKRIFGYRQREMQYIRNLLLIRAANEAIASSLPVLASVMAFVTYSLSGHDLDPATIFTSLTLFNLLRLAVGALPSSFSAIVDASNATGRLSAVFEAELLEGTQVIDPELPYAVQLDNASFTWDGLALESDVPASTSKSKTKDRRGAARTPNAIQPSSDVEKDQQQGFRIENVNMTIPRGKLVAIVGPIGMGKSSLLQGIVGEMRKTAGSVTLGGSVAYCPQSAWIQNATIRENVTFGRPFEETKYWKAIEDACLLPDLESLPHADLTEVGERGISLSGGQKQRLNIARALYCDTDIQIFDDPLSALDAHVGKAVFNKVLLNSLSGKTRILVTHALHFLPQVDYIFTVVDGYIAERGTYPELMSSQGAFSRFITEFAAQDEEMQNDEEVTDAIEPEKREDEGGETKFVAQQKQAPTGSSKIMQPEERVAGAVGAKVYKEYLAGKGMLIGLPLLVLSLVLLEVMQVLSSYWLVYWQEMKWPKPQGFYVAIYAALGVGQAVSFFIMGSSCAIIAYFASQRLHRLAIERVMHAPMSFFETTPLGRIMNRFSKDIDTVDNSVVDAYREVFNTSTAIVGAVIMISILLPWFLIAVLVISICSYYAAIFYRSSARESKRLDAILRSSLYAHFSESLSGLATIRAYGETERFQLNNERHIDVENRAYWVAVTIQRWLGMRIDFFASMLVFCVAIMTVATRFTISPSQTGLALSYIMSVQLNFNWLVREVADVENDMNSVERVVYYATQIEQEPPHELPDTKPPAPWPSDGAVELRSVVMKYRPELPPVLRGMSMAIRPREKIGIVGRTGAGKSSIMTALYRLVELTSGSILIDGVDISKIGLRDLRSSISIIPQDSLLFSGTLRSNLDPFDLHDDAKLWDALKRSFLVDQYKTASIGSSSRSFDSDIRSGASTPTNSKKSLTLDSMIEDEGSNLSIGQRSLVSLARALVLDTKILILDEATASVDFQTDRYIQDTIASEFRDRTILCIAHRLRTIISYDRICVMDAGQIHEFDTPISLFNKPDSIFRAMCDRSAITLDDIRLAAKVAAEMRTAVY